MAAPKVTTATRRLTRNFGNMNLGGRGFSPAMPAALKGRPPRGGRPPETVLSLLTRVVGGHSLRLPLGEFLLILLLGEERDVGPAVSHFIHRAAAPADPGRRIRVVTIV